MESPFNNEEVRLVVLEFLVLVVSRNKKLTVLIAAIVFGYSGKEVDEFSQKLIKEIGSRKLNTPTSRPAPVTEEVVKIGTSFVFSVIAFAKFDDFEVESAITGT